MAEIACVGRVAPSGLIEAMAGSTWVRDASMTGSLALVEAPESLDALIRLASECASARMEAGLAPAWRLEASETFARHVLWPALAPPAAPDDEVAMRGLNA